MAHIFYTGSYGIYAINGMLKFTVVPIQPEKDPLSVAERESYCGDDIYYDPHAVGEMSGEYGAEGTSGEDATGYEQEPPKKDEKKKDGSTVLFGDVMHTLGINAMYDAIFD